MAKASQMAELLGGNCTFAAIANVTQSLLASKSCCNLCYFNRGEYLTESIHLSCFRQSLLDRFPPSSCNDMFLSLRANVNLSPTYFRPFASRELTHGTCSPYFISRGFEVKGLGQTFYISYALHVWFDRGSSHCGHNLSVFVFHIVSISSLVSVLAE